MIKVIPFIFVFGLFFQARAAKNCSSVFKYDSLNKVVVDLPKSLRPVFLGDPAKIPLQGLDIDPAETRFLGQGLSQAAKVYRVKFLDGGFANIKIYFSDKAFENDIKAFAYLRSHESELPFWVAKSNGLPFHSDVLVMENLYGSSVERVYDSLPRDSIYKGRLVEIYSQAIHDFYKWVEKRSTEYSQHYFFQMPSGLPEVRFKLWDSTSIYIHPGNVLIEYNTGQLIIIDPY